MAILVSAHNLRKSFAARPLFDALTFAIESGERIGLIGPNGAGKSTLLRILAGKASPDDGKVSLQRALRIGYLEQVPEFKPGATIHSTVLEGTEDPDDWESMALADECLSKLHLNGANHGPEALVDKLSGGWKKRVALARELVRKPDLLLLDEPTNHLDVESILWLEELLANARYATLTVTHDRLFLQRIANRILELDPRNPGGLLSIKGDYAAYLDAKGQLMHAQERREIILKNTLRRETEWIRRGAKARTTKQQARIQRHGELSDDVAELTTRNQVRTARLDFQSADRNPKRLIEAKKIAKSHGGRKLFENVDLFIGPGARVGLLGPNGCGKSTLIRVLLGQEAPDQGEVIRSEHLQVAYFEQNRETLDPAITVSRTLCPRGDFVDYRGGQVHIRGYLDRFLFTQGQMDMAVGKLSGGEQSRLLIARLMLKEANVLVLDEPTNDLDMATLTVLEECLTEFPGAVLLVTHDRYFLDQVARKILGFEFDTSVVTPFEGLDQWEAWHATREAREEAAAAAAAKAAARKTPVTGAGASAAPQSAPAGAAAAATQRKRKLSFKEQRELETMEATIHQAEAELERLTVESANPAHLSNATKLSELTRAMSATQAEIDRLYARWAELES